MYEWYGDEEVHRRVAWDQIEKVIAFKLDLFTFDEIWVAVLNDQGEVLACLPETSGSFYSFIKSLPTWLIGCKRPEEWWEEVAIPAFQRNETEIYRRCRPQDLN